MILDEKYTLRNGVQIPKMGLGTWQIDNDTAHDAAKAALDIGYRLIDTAAAYDNESGIGRAVVESGIRCEEAFLSTKIPADVKTYEGAKAVIEQSLSNLGTDYIDLMLIHSPKPWPELFAKSEKTYFEENLAVWKAMEEAYRDEKLRAIGVSNFETADIQNLIDHAETAPMANQIRVHVGHTPTEIIGYCQERDILVMAYSPNATGKLLHHLVVEEMAAKYDVTVPQLCIRYDLQLGLLPLPKTTHEEYMRQNAEVGFEISPVDMKTLSEVEEVSSL